MSVSTDIRDSIMAAVDTIAMRRINQLKLDKTIKAVIKNKIGVVNGRNTYRVEYNGGFFNATAQNKDDAYLPRMAVYVSIPEGDFSNEKFIIGRATNVATGEQLSAVAATASNYGIIGQNTLSTITTDKIGVYSYHSTKEEINNPNSISHRYNFLYQEGREQNQIIPKSDNLTLYKQSANAIMFRADFMNILSTDQRELGTGEFGLIFNLVFKNPAADLGQFQGEVFDHFSQILKVNEEVSLEDGTIESKTISLQDIDTDIQNAMTEEDFENFVKEDGYIDQQIDKIQEMQRIFQKNNLVQYTESMQKIIEAYQEELSYFKYCENMQNVREEYAHWREVEIGEPAEKIISYFLSSNDMIGNPYFFTSWTSQYAVFNIDFENFLRVESILLYKEGFIQNEQKEKHWPVELDSRGALIENSAPDILVQNIQMYFMQPLSDYNGIYQLKTESTNRDIVFNNKEDSTPIKMKATFTREFYEDLTYNSETRVMWFKQNSNIISPENVEYSIYAGVGWAEIKNNYSPILDIYAKDATAYENHYRCVIIYTGEDPQIVLRQDFIVYNRSGQEFIIESDLGNNFAFNAGVPTLTVKKRIPNEDNFEEPLEDNYRFSWAIIDQNGQKTFLDQKPELSLTNITVANYTNFSSLSKITDKVEFYHGDELIVTENKDKATRIKYPMSNIATASNAIFEVYVRYREDAAASFTDLGKALFEINNFNDANFNINGYRIFIENGDQVFQYDEYGDAPTEAKRKDPQTILPLKAHLFGPNNLEITSSNFRVTWYFPTRQSLITYTGAERDPSTDLYNIFKGTEVGFGINKFYDYNAIDNQIICEVAIHNYNAGDTILRQSTNFFFGKVGQNGTNGTDMVAKIVPVKDNVLYSEQPPTLYAYKNNEDNVKVFFNTESYYGKNESIIADGLNDGFFTVKLYQKNEEITFENMRWNIVGNTSTGSNVTGRYLQLENNSIIWRNDFNSNKYFQQIIRAEIKYNSNETYYAKQGIPLIKYEQRPGQYIKNRIAISNKDYLKEVLYNADGRNPVYDHNGGLKLLNLPDNYVISWKACGGYNQEENSPNFKLLLDKTQDKKDAQIELIETEQDMVYILPNDTYSGSITNNYIKAIVYQQQFSDTEEYILESIATVYAPIDMSLNTFGLASLNAWDGNKIDIDEEGGYIMAPQIGAGEKDENNRFTGIVMGKTETQTGGVSSESEVGLFGYAHGLQSIFLDANSGNAYFGLPDGTKLEKDNQTLVPQKGQDNYNEGRIELIPGGESKVGGWRLGRQSLYYIQGEEGAVEIGKKYETDYIPKKSGAVAEGDAYNEHHKKDIPEEYPGILLHAGEAPYISVKGRKLYPEIQYDENGQELPNQHPDTELLSQSAESYLLNGDSLELQLDPQTPTLFTIFRHNGQTRYKDSEKTKPLYPEGSRTFLAGINSRGQLVANGLQTVTKPTESAAGDTVTTFGIDTLPAFGDTLENASYIGLKLDAGENRIAKIFVKNENNLDANQSTLYISGSDSVQNEYMRPISLHGKDIFLYASTNSSNKKTTNANIKITSNYLSGETGNSSFKFYASDIDGNEKDQASEVTSAGNMNILVGKNSRKNLKIQTAEQTIDSTNIKITNTGTYTINSKNVINITTTDDNNINIIRNNSGTQLNLNNADLALKVNNNNGLFIDSNVNKQSSLKTERSLEVLSTNGSLKLSGKGNDDSSDYGIVMTANSTSNKNATLSLRAHYSGGSSHPFDLNLGNAGNIWVNFDTTYDNNRGLSSFYVGMSQQLAGGLEIRDGIGWDPTITANAKTQEKRLNISGHKAGASDNTNWGALQTNYIVADGGKESPAHGYTFGTTSESIEKKYKNEKGEELSFTASGYNLYDLIEDCLTAAAKARQAAADAHSRANAAYTRAEEAMEEAGKKVSKTTYNGHNHTFDAVTTGAKTVTRFVDSEYQRATFRLEKDGDSYKIEREDDSTWASGGTGMIFGGNGAAGMYKVQTEDEDFTVVTGTKKATSSMPSPQA